MVAAQERHLVGIPSDQIQNMIHRRTRGRLDSPCFEREQQRDGLKTVVPPVHKITLHADIAHENRDPDNRTAFHPRETHWTSPSKRENTYVP